MGSLEKLDHFLNRYKYLLLIFIVGVGFALRLTAAMTAPLNEDEWYDFRSARHIVLEPGDWQLPLLDTNVDNSSMAVRYFMALGWVLFGDTTFGARMPFVILGTLTILLLYFLTKDILGVRIGLLAALLLSISQFAIGSTRFPDLSAVIPLFVVGSLYVFVLALKKKSNKFLLINGVIMGISFWFKETMLILVPSYILFLVVSPDYRGLLKNKYLWISFSVSLLIAVPLYIQIFNPASHRIDYIKGAIDFELTLGPLSLYAGELFLYIIKPFPEFFSRVATTVNSELLLFNFVLGAIILTAVLRYLTDRRPFVRLLIIHFWFVFIIFSFLKTGDPTWGIWNFEAFYYSANTIIPGIILAALLMDEAMDIHRLRVGSLTILLIIFMLIRAWDITTYPASFFYPAKNFCVNELLNYRWGCFRNNPNISDKTALKTFEGIQESPRMSEAFRIKAAFKIAEILLKQGNFKRSKEYLYWILSRNPENSQALTRLKEINNINGSYSKKNN